MSLIQTPIEEIEDFFSSYLIQDTIHWRAHLKSNFAHPNRVSKQTKQKYLVVLLTNIEDWLQPADQSKTILLLVVLTMTLRR